MTDDHGRVHHLVKVPYYPMINVPKWQQQLPVMTHRKTSPFILIKRCAEVEGWGVVYMDHGVGHDSHVFTHKKRRQVLSVYYRASKPIDARFQGEKVELHRILDILTGVDAAIGKRRGA